MVDDRRVVLKQWCLRQVHEMPWHTLHEFAAEGMLELFDPLTDAELATLIEDCEELGLGL